MDAFVDWSASYSWDIHRRADAKTRDLAYLIRSVIVGFESGDLSEAEVREELANAIRPFVRSALDERIRVEFEPPAVSSLWDVLLTRLPRVDRGLLTLPVELA